MAAAPGPQRGIPQFTNLRATPRAGPRGGTYELSWFARGATVVEIDGYGLRGPMGSVAVAFDGVPQLRVTAYGPDGHTSVLSPPTVTFADPVIGLALPMRPRRVLGGGHRDTHWQGAQAPAPSELLGQYELPGPDGGAGEDAGPALTVRPSSWVRLLATPAGRFWRTAGWDRSWNTHFRRSPASETAAEPGAPAGGRGGENATENTGARRWWRRR